MKAESGQFSSTARFFIAVAAAGISLFFLSRASAMINSFILALIIVVCFMPMLNWLKRKGLHPILAYTITLVTIFVVFIAIVVFVVAAVVRFIDAIPTYTQQLESAIDGVQEFIASLGLDAYLNFEALQKIFDPGKLLGFIANFLAGLIGGLSDIFLVALIVIFLLVDAMGVPEKILPYLQSGNATVTRVFGFGADVRRYIIVTTIVGVVTGFFDTILFFILGVDFAVLWGILAFFMSYVPTLGFWLALIPPTFLALLESGPVAALVVFLGIVIINGIAENVVKPKYMGEELDLSPFTVVFSVVFWSAVLGPMGAILAVPVTMGLKSLILEPDPANRWWADLLSAKPHEVGEEVLDQAVGSEEQTASVTEQAAAE